MVFNSPISFKNDKIYFVFIDRFHDGELRITDFSKTRKIGYGDKDELAKFYGGNLKGVTLKLPYIKGMGFTAIWLSPFFQNTPNAYHGYAIKDFTEVDSNFGTKADLKELIVTAHSVGIKVYMDVIINHMGNVFSYLGDYEYKYNQGLKFPFGNWNYVNYPQPKSLQNPNFFKKRGAINNWENESELMFGDFFELKKFKLDESEISLKLQHILFDIYYSWIIEFDFDGFRIDTVRHINPLVVNRFVHNIKKKAYLLGKMEFPVFLEAPFLKEEQLLPYFSYQKDKNGNVYEPADGFIDFQLHFDIPHLVSKRFNCQKLKNRFVELNKIRQKSPSPIYQIGFLDNHDQVGEIFKQRISNKLNNFEIMNAWEMLLSLQTIPCLYYGTEQGLSGSGEHDKFIRESMFDKKSNKDLFDNSYILYKKIRTLNRKYKS